MSGYRLIIFDLDGTLLDTSKGIFNSVRYAEEKMGLLPTAEENLRKFVGPPPAEMYRELYGLDEEASLQAAMWHREYGRNRAIYEASLYDGVPETLARLSKQGYLLSVATLKRQDIAERVLSFYGIDGYFTHIVGMNMEETDTKAGLIKRICEWEDVTSGNEVLMIGDSFYDHEGAMETGVDFVGVSYGFGFDGSEDGIRFADSFREIRVLAIGGNK